MRKTVKGQIFLLNAIVKQSFSLGILHTFLSWEAFIPVARCSYVMYLIHMFYVDILPGMTGFQITFSYFDLVRSKRLFHIPNISSMILAGHAGCDDILCHPANCDPSGAHL